MLKDYIAEKEFVLYVGCEVLSAVIGDEKKLKGFHLVLTTTPRRTLNASRQAELASEPFGEMSSGECPRGFSPLHSAQTGREKATSTPQPHFDISDHGPGDRTSKTDVHDILRHRPFTQRYLRTTTGSRSSAPVLRFYGRAKQWR